MKRWQILVINVCLGALLQASPTGLVISEIMYNPPGDDAALEYVEIHNFGPVIYDISGYRLDGGVSFTFAEGTFIEGRGYLVVAADADRIATEYGIDNVTGNFERRLENSGETISLCEPGGAAVTWVDYNDRGKWPSAADGTGHSLILADVYSDPSKGSNWSWSPELGGSPGQPNSPEIQITEEVVLPSDALWHYKKGTEPPSSPLTAWRELTFDDSGWLVGQTGIGYGDGDDHTVLGDMQNSYLSVFARTIFTVDDPDAMDELFLKMDFDDGFVAYLNGVEVARVCCGTSGQDFPHDQVATCLHEAGGAEYFPIGNPGGILRTGDNILACQIQNYSLGSSDLSFIPSLIKRHIHIPEEFVKTPLVINEVQPGPDAFVELRNTSDQTIPMDGFRLTLDTSGAPPYVFPAGTFVGPRGFLVVEAADLPYAIEGLEVRLFLWRLDDTIVDARIFVPQGIDGSHARYPDGGDTWVHSTKPTPGEPNQLIVEDGVVINEILYNHISGDPRYEYIELYNRSAAAVDLSDCRFVKGVAFTFAEGVIFMPNSYLVIAADREFLKNMYGLSDGIVFGDFTGSLADRGELLRLVDPHGNVMDEVRYYDGGRWPVMADGLGSSLELIDAHQDNNAPSAWAASDEPAKSSWTRVEYNGTCPQTPRESELHILLTEAGECLIDNLSIEPVGLKQNLVPNGDFELSSMGNWTITGTHAFSHRTTDYAAGGNASLHIIATGRGNNRANHLELDTTQALQASRTYRISFDARWLAGCNVLHTRGFEYGLMHTEKLSLPANLGSPGQRNSRHRDETGPIITKVTQDPVVPSTNQQVRVAACVSDDDGILAVQLYYTTGSPQGFQNTLMYDDGTHGDTVGGDGVWSGFLPGFTQGTKVLFYIEATDARGDRGTHPSAAPAQTCLYQVDSTVTSQLFVYRLILDDANQAELQNRPLHSNHLLDGTFVFNEEKIYYNVGIRYRGSPWQRRNNPKMFRVSLNDDEPFLDTTSFNLSRYGTRQNERTAYYTLRLNGAPTSFQYYVRLHVNGAHHGTFEHIQPINQRYLELWYPDDPEGKLYKISGRHIFFDDGSFNNSWCTFTYKGSSDDQYRWWFLPRTREVENDHTELRNLCWLMDSTRTPHTTFDSQVELSVDTEQWLRVQTVRILNDDWDTIGVSNGQNAYIYFAPREGRWKLLPWDVDHTFGNTNASLDPEPERGMARFLDRPRYERMYLRFLTEFIAEPYTVPFLSPLLDGTYEVLSTEAGGSANPQGIKNYVTARANRVRSFLPSAAPFLITTANGQDFETDSDHAVLQGTAPVAAATIEVNGNPLHPQDIRWQTTTNWSTTIALLPGENELLFQACDNHGSVLGFDSITVTSNITWPPPTITAMFPTEGPARGGTDVRIIGTGFQDTSIVFFGDVQAEANNDGASLLIAISPPGTGDVTISVENPDLERAESPWPFHYIPDLPSFVRGDANADDAVDLGDGIFILQFLFANGPEPPCIDAADTNDDGNPIDVSDGVYLLQYLFANGPTLPAPHAECGTDPTEDALLCESYRWCE